MVTWHDRAIENPPQASDAAVADAERELRVRLPADFLAVARVHQGAKPDPAAFDLEGGDETEISRLLHFEAEPFVSNIVARGFPLQGVLPKGVIPFAEDGGGDLLCFDYRRDREHPSVVFFSHDGGPELQPVAESFTALLDKLHD